MSDSPWKRLYNERANDYERLIRNEDFEGNLFKALNQLHPIQDAEIVEFGAGTGRVTAQLVPSARRVSAFDLTPSMIKVAPRKLAQQPKRNWSLGLADNRAMPVQDHSADVTIEGWSFAQIASWNSDAWQQEVGKALSEMLRIVRPGGTAIMIETLGTGSSTPTPPERFVPLYRWLETEWHFNSMWIRTDIRYASEREAAELITPLFGEATLKALIQTAEGVVLPECTGIWWRRGRL